MTYEPTPKEKAISRYLQLNKWLVRRYKTNGFLVVSIGGVNTKYENLDRAAFEKYILAF